jgi:hypothetical protein
LYGSSIFFHHRRPPNSRTTGLDLLTSYFVRILDLGFPVLRFNMFVRDFQIRFNLQALSNKTYNPRTKSWPFSRQSDSIWWMQSIYRRLGTLRRRHQLYFGCEAVTPRESCASSRDSGGSGSCVAWHACRLVGQAALRARSGTGEADPEPRGEVQQGLKAAAR